METLESLISERDRLKAEVVLSFKKGQLSAHEHCFEMQKDRDLWKQKAEKLAVVLRRVAKEDLIDEWGAKAALAEYAKGV